MAPSYLTRSRLAWLGIVMILAGFATKWAVTAAGLPFWIVPLGYFVALAGAGVLFVGWVRWRAIRRTP